MARIEIPEVVWTQGAAGAALQTVADASVQVNLRAGGAATVYAAETGGTTLANPLTTTSTGAIEGWLEEGSYDLVVSKPGVLTSYTQRFEAASGASAASIRPAVAQLPVTASVANYPGLDPTGVADSTTALQSFFNDAAAKGRGFIPAGNYKHGNIQVPSTLGNAGGLVIQGASPYLTKLTYTGTGYGITFGDNGTFSTNYQTLERVELIGNASALGAVQFNYTRWCGLRRSYIHGFTNATANAVLINSLNHNYFNEIEGNWFADNRCHLKLAGNAAGLGANSNYIFLNMFGTVTGPNAVVVDGGDTNRIYYNEFDGPHAVSVRFENSDAINNELFSNQFDGPVKAWEIAGASVVDTQLLWNKGATAVAGATDLGVRTSRVDQFTEQAKVHLTNSANQAVANSLFPFYVVLYNTETYDPSGMHDGTNSGRITVLVAGKYRITANLQFAAQTPAAGIRMGRITKNGVAVALAEQDVNPPSDGTSPTFLHLDCEQQLAAGDYVQVVVYQTSGVSLNLVGGATPGTQFSMERIG